MKAKHVSSINMSIIDVMQFSVLGQHPERANNLSKQSISDDWFTHRCQKLRWIATAALPTERCEQDAEFLDIVLTSCTNPDRQ